MVVKGSEIEIFDDFEVEFGESCIYTENRLARRTKRFKKEFGGDLGGLTITVKGVSLYDIPCKCILSYDKKGKLGSIAFKILASDLANVPDPSSAANDILEKCMTGLQESFGKDRSKWPYKVRLEAAGADKARVFVTITPLN